MTVRDGSQPAAPRRVQQREIAERAGVSVSTVSRVLNRTPGISEPIQQKVLAAAAELGYQPAEARRPGRLQHVSLLTNLPLALGLDLFHADVLSGVERVCGQEGLHLSYATFGSGSSNGDVALERLRQNVVDGLLLLSIDEPDVIAQARALQLPMVMINVDQRELPVDAFLPDNRLGALLAVRHLIAQGHRRILHITSSQRRTIRRRAEAYEDALAEAGIAVDPALLLDIQLNAESAYAAMRERLAGGRPDFTAAFCANDLSAMGLMRAAQEAGLRIPQDLSVVGFDDIATAAFLSPPLTTVRIEAAELARLAVRRLIDRAAAPDLPSVRVSLACRLVERQSVARPRARG